MPNSLLLLFCLLSATNLGASLSSSTSGSKVNLRPETPSNKHFAATEDVISGSGSSKQNGIATLPKTARSVARNEERSKITPSSAVDRPRNDAVEVADRAGPSSYEGSQVESILSDVVENLASLRDLVNNLKYQNHVMYRQMKKMQTRYCGGNSRNRILDDEPSAAAPAPHQHQSLQQQDGRYNSRDDHYSNVPGPVSAALRVEMAAGHDAGGTGSRGGPAKAAGDGGGGGVGGGVCPSQFSYSGETDRCYRLSGDRMTWKLARERCRWMKGSLASIDSAKEQRIINDMARSNPATQHCDFWIGLTRQGPMSSKDWYWDGDGHLPSYSNWNEHEPNNGNGEEHCTQMLWLFNWRWNDAPCNHGNACFVCETRPTVTTPAAALQ